MSKRGTYSYNGPEIPIKVSKPNIPNTSGFQTSDLLNNSTASTIAKWVPLICAGAAVGVSVMALKEIKNVRRELVILKKDQVSSKSGTQGNAELYSKMEMMDEQLKKISDFLANQSSKNKREFTSQRSERVEREQRPDVRIINEETEQGVEYEEVEVTDDEAEEEGGDT